jgi:hypothetical protein
MTPTRTTLNILAVRPIRTQHSRTIVLTAIALLFVAPAFAQDATKPEEVLANNDLNKDGVITREEATKAGRQLAQLWDYFDLNKDGKVDMDELKKVLATTPAPKPPDKP